MQPKRTLGLLVCGGQSRRMGTDKALLELAGARLVDRAVQALESVADEVLLATGSEPRYGELGRECVLDVLPGAGPLAGLVAGLRVATERGAGMLVASACDTPRANALVFSALSRKLVGSAADAVLLRGTHGVEPLIAVYRTSCYMPARAALEAGRRRMTSFHEDLEVLYLDETEVAIEAPATNLNTPEELSSERLFFGEVPGRPQTELEA